VGLAWQRGAEEFARLSEARHPANDAQLVKHQPARTYENQYGKQITSSEPSEPSDSFLDLTLLGKSKVFQFFSYLSILNIGPSMTSSAAIAAWTVRSSRTLSHGTAIMFKWGSIQARAFDAK
jgi:hypothetical protein